MRSTEGLRRVGIPCPPYFGHLLSEPTKSAPRSAFSLALEVPACAHAQVKQLAELESVLVRNVGFRRFHLLQSHGITHRF